MTKVKLSVGRTYNTGKFEFLRLDVGLERDIDDDSNIAAEFKRITTMLKIELSNQEEEWGISGVRTPLKTKDH